MDYIRNIFKSWHCAIELIQRYFRYTEYSKTNFTKGNELVQETKKPNKALVAIIIVVLLAVAIGGVAYVTKDGATMNEAGSTDNSASTTAPDAGTGGVSSATYADGTYSATGEYRSPEGQQSIDVTVTLAENTIRDITATGTADSGTSQQYQDKFESGYKAEVVGKNINEVNLSRVAGSSLTPQGFNDAISKIKDDARA